MNAHSLQQSWDDFTVDPAPPLNVLMICEDEAARRRAQGVYEHLAERLAGEFVVDCSWWQFYELCDAETANRAARTAMNAHLVFFVAQADTRPPAVVRLWVEKWLVCGVLPDCALVAFLGYSDLAEIEALPFTRYLQEIAQRTRMDLVTPATITHSREASIPTAPETKRSTLTVSAAPEGPGWEADIRTGQ